MLSPINVPRQDELRRIALRYAACASVRVRKPTEQALVAFNNIMAMEAFSLLDDANLRDDLKSL